MCAMRQTKRCVFILLVAWSVAIGQQTPERPASPHQDDVAQYVLGPEDQIKIWALGVEEISDKPIRIDPSGEIDLPLVGRVHAAGLTVEQIGRASCRESVDLGGRGIMEKKKEKLDGGVRYHDTHRERTEYGENLSYA